MPRVKLFLVSTTKILSYISENVTTTIPCSNGSSVSRFSNYVYPRTDSDQISGDFNPGVQPRGTFISAEVIHGGDVDINVIWRDARGRAVTSSWSKSSGWDLPSPNGGKAHRDGRDSS